MRKQVSGGGRAVEHYALVVAQKDRCTLGDFAFGDRVSCYTAVEIRRLIVAVKALRTAVGAFQIKHIFKGCKVAPNA